MTRGTKEKDKKKKKKKKKICSCFEDNNIILPIILDIILGII